MINLGNFYSEWLGLPPVARPEQVHRAASVVARLRAYHSPGLPTYMGLAATLASTLWVSSAGGAMRCKSNA